MIASDQGNVSLGVLSLAMMVMVLSLALADLGLYLLGRSKAQTAADAAALAAAAELVPGLGRRDPEGLARQFAGLNGGNLEQCVCGPGSREATVTVSVPVRFALLRLTGVRNAKAVAKADVQLSRRNVGPKD